MSAEKEQSSPTARLHVGSTWLSAKLGECGHSRDIADMDPHCKGRHLPVPTYPMLTNSWVKPSCLVASDLGSVLVVQIPSPSSLTGTVSKALLRGLFGELGMGP